MCQGRLEDAHIRFADAQGSRSDNEVKIRPQTAFIHQALHVVIIPRIRDHAHAVALLAQGF